MSYANLISIGRLLCVPLLIWLCLMGLMKEAFWVFCIAGASDFLDGLLARLLKERTQLGAFLDPLADKALLVGTFVTLAFLGFVPLWLVILVVFRDLLIVVGTLLILLFDKELSIDPLFISKLNTAAQILLLAFLLGAAALGQSHPYISAPLIWLVGLTTFLSGASYVKLWIKLMNQESVRGNS